MKQKKLKLCFIVFIFVIALLGCRNDTQTSCPLNNVTKEEEWKLILVNNTHPLPTNYSVELALVKDYINVDKRISESTAQLLATAKKDGIDLIVSSSYRSILYQQEIFDNSIAEHVADGCSTEKAIALTLVYYAKPLTSEHHTGLALDIVCPEYQVLDEGFENTDAAKWLLENASDYGFVLRYPKDKEDITKIKYEPWHYRYVGKDHASYMKKNNLCLEEYLLAKCK